jgi:hypothetical protein
MHGLWPSIFEEFVEAVKGDYYLAQTLVFGSGVKGAASFTMRMRRIDGFSVSE